MIGIVGLNHKTAAVDVRERLSFAAEEIPPLLSIMSDRLGIPEAVVLSTCNRTEVYFHSPEDCLPRHSSGIMETLCKAREVTADLTPHLYSVEGPEAVRHLFSVAAGLDSMVLGENQILGQVKQAYRVSAETGRTSRVLNRLFHKAFEAGKRVRSETAITQGAASVGAAAVELAARIFDNLDSHEILLVGAGDTGEQVLKSFSERGSRSLLVTNRTHSRAEELAQKYRSRAVSYEGLAEHLESCDVVITSVSTPDPIITRAAFREIMHRRRNRPVFLIDLSVPRAVEERVRDVENAFLYTIDDLQEVVAYSFQQRAGEVRKAEAIVAELTRDYCAWLDAMQLSPTIESLKSRLESISSQELAKLKNRLAESEFEKVREYAQFINGKYMGILIKNLKSLSGNGRRLECIEIVNGLFELGSDRPE
jgi:glutamyl-tRNA reductase